jgi:hypothetical protein
MQLIAPLGATSYAFAQNIHSILWHPKVYFHVFKNLPPAPMLNQINPVHTTPSFLSKNHFNVYLPTHGLTAASSKATTSTTTGMGPVGSFLTKGRAQSRANEKYLLLKWEANIEMVNGKVLFAMRRSIHEQSAVTASC